MCSSAFQRHSENIPRVFASYVETEKKTTSKLKNPTPKLSMIVLISVLRVYFAFCLL